MDFEQVRVAYSVLAISFFGMVDTGHQIGFARSSED